MADCRLTSENISVTIPVTDCHTIPLHLHTYSPLNNDRFPQPMCTVHWDFRTHNKIGQLTNHGQHSECSQLQL